MSQKTTGDINEEMKEYAKRDEQKAFTINMVILWVSIVLSTAAIIFSIYSLK